MLSESRVGISIGIYLIAIEYHLESWNILTRNLASSRLYEKSFSRENIKFWNSFSQSSMCVIIALVSSVLNSQKSLLFSISQLCLRI